ncbi:thiamine-phosphate kinase [Rhodocyclaceae bacterium]
MIGAPLAYPLLTLPSEFALINRYFKRPTPNTILGVGDDGAILQPSAGCELVVSTDMLVAGTHFLPNDDPTDLGWKVLAVNVSDMAAMGAQPKWALLAAALPAATASWIEKFASGFFACADAFGIDVIGGDTTKGPRNFCVTIFGEVPAGTALLRSGARPGDEIWVSGMPGRAAQGLAHLQGQVTLDEPALTDCLSALHRPQPRAALGLALHESGLATAAIDVSDGLLADLSHILEQSGVSATLKLAVLPAPTFAEQCYLSGGDDYELLFTAAAERHSEVLALSQRLELPLTCIGQITAGRTTPLAVQTLDGVPVEIVRQGYDHFAP